MKHLFKLGVTASLMAAVVLSGCQKSDDDKPSSNKQRHVQSELCEYTENGVLHQNKTEYAYDAKWNKTLVNHTSVVDGAEVSSSKNEYKYDDKGNEVWYYRISTDNGVATYTEELSRKYDGNGNVIEFQQVRDYNDGSIVSEKFEYKYNEHGDHTEMILTNNSGIITRTWEYQYDNKGNKTNVEEYFNGVLQGKRTIQYDEQGNATKEETYSFNISTNEFGLTSKTEYTYDGNTKNFIEEIYSNDGTENHSVVIVFTDSKREKIKNQTTKITYTDGRTNNSEEKYSYDNEGHLTLYEWYRNGILISKRGYEGNVSFNYSYSETGELNYSSKTVYTDSNRDKPLTIETIGTNYSSKIEYTYDNDENEIGFKRYSNGVLVDEIKDYVYDGNKLTYTSLDYDEETGELYRTNYYTIIFCE